LSSQALSSRLTPIKRAAQKCSYACHGRNPCNRGNESCGDGTTRNLILLDFVLGSFYNTVHQIKLKPDQWRCPACPARCRTSMR